MSYSVKDTNGKEVLLQVLSDKYPVEGADLSFYVNIRGEEGKVKLPLPEFMKMVAYVVTNWRGKLPSDVVAILKLLGRMFTVVPVTSLSEPLNPEK
jgi:hypothetical protein